jgi:hypothetical protein
MIFGIIERGCPIFRNTELMKAPPTKGEGLGRGQQICKSESESLFPEHIGHTQVIQAVRGVYKKYLIFGLRFLDNIKNGRIL